MSRIGISLATTLLLVAVTSCARGQPLARAAVDDGRALWAKNGVQHYRLVLEVSGDRIEQGTFVSEVKGGAVVSLSRNGQPSDTRDPFYTVPGLFEFLEDELAIAADPTRAWGVPKGTSIHQRAAFDERRGHPTRYLRSVHSTELNITVIVRELTPL